MESQKVTMLKTKQMKRNNWKKRTLNQKRIGDKESYKYLWILEAYSIMHSIWSNFSPLHHSQVDHLSHPIMLALVFLLRQFSAFILSDWLFHVSEKTRGVVAKILDCDLEVSEFELQSCYYVHFQTNTL